MNTQITLGADSALSTKQYAYVNNFYEPLIVIHAVCWDSAKNLVDNWLAERGFTTRTFRIVPRTTS